MLLPPSSQQSSLQSSFQGGKKKKSSLNSDIFSLLTEDSPLLEVNLFSVLISYIYQPCTRVSGGAFSHTQRRNKIWMRLEYEHSVNCNHKFFFFFFFPEVSIFCTVLCLQKYIQINKNFHSNCLWVCKYFCWMSSYAMK